jgi:hypothetical protein
MIIDFPLGKNAEKGRERSDLFRLYYYILENNNNNNADAMPCHAMPCHASTHGVFLFNLKFL